MSELVISSKPTFIIPEIKAFAPKISLSQISSVNEECHINATDDLGAINAWLNQHKTSLKTYDVYKKEAERLLEGWHTTRVFYTPSFLSN